MVGAVNDRDNVGSVYVFRYNADGSGEWVQVAKLTQDNASSYSQGNFGHSVAIASQDGGFVVAVGAPNDGTSGGRRRNGRVYVYSSSGSGSSFELLQKIVPSELLGGYQFRSSLAVENAAAYPNDNTNIQKSRIANGARLRDDKGMDSRSVYMYLRQVGVPVWIWTSIKSLWERRNSMVWVERIAFNMMV